MSDNFCGLNNPKLGNCEVFLVHLLHEFEKYSNLPLKNID